MDRLGARIRLRCGAVVCRNLSAHDRPHHGRGCRRSRRR